MATVNYVRLLFYFLIAVTVILSSLLNVFEKYLPAIVKQLIRYGKFAYNDRATVVKKLEVPKSCFRHFYIYSSVMNLLALGMMLKVYMFHSDPPILIAIILDGVGGIYREATVTSTHAILALSLITFHCIRRLYESYFVSVYGTNGKINMPQYLLALIHYTGVRVTILIEAPLFSPTVIRSKTELCIFDLKVIDYLAIAFFLWASQHQHTTTVILGNLRKNSKGEVVTQKYRLPKGDWFKYLSSPHSTAEVLIYFSITVILRGNTTWLLVFVWVFFNQVETILLSHWWYQETFKKFPYQRKALIPFLY